MKKIYQAPEIEYYEVKELCQIEGPSESGGEVTPNGNENKTFEENDMVGVSAPTNLWDD